jgi:hypothetical protein
MDSVAPATATFSERAFYLREFSGRTVAIAGSASPDPDDLARAVQELTGAGTRVVVMGSAGDPLDKVVDGRWLQAGADRLEAEVWRALRSVPCLGIALDPGRPLLADVRDLAARLGVFKLVLLDAEGGMLRPNGRLASFVHLEELWALLERHPERAPLLREVEATLLTGVPSVNVCPPDGLWDELFPRGTWRRAAPRRWITCSRTASGPSWRDAIWPGSVRCCRFRRPGKPRSRPCMP